MIYIKNKNFFKPMIGLLFILLLGLNAFPWLVVNQIGIVFNSTGGPDRAAMANEFTFKGGNYFLEAYTNALGYLKIVENETTERLDTTEVNLYLDTAIQNMNYAIEAFKHLHEETKTAVYNRETVRILKSLDYNEVRLSISADKENFREVSFFLKKADIQGLVGKIISNMEGINKTLIQLKKKISQGILAAIPLTWELNAQFSKTLLFGQYSAQIFTIIQNRSRVSN